MAAAQKRQGHQKAGKVSGTKKQLDESFATTVIVLKTENKRSRVC